MQMEQLRKDMMAAMKARDKERKDAISSLVSAVKKNAIDAGCRDDIPEDMVNATIMKELKTVQEQIDSCPADRTDLLEEYRKRYESLLLFAGVSIASVARRLGHASMTTTQKTYLHIIQELESKDIDLVMRSLSELS